MKPASVLFVDDDVDHASFLVNLATDAGWSVAKVASAPAALELMGQSPYDIVVTDVHMPGVDGVQLIEVVGRLWPDTAVIAITAFGSVDTALRTLRAGAVDYLSKPFQPTEIIARIQQAIDRRARRLEQDRLRRDVEEVLRRRTR